MSNESQTPLDVDEQQKEHDQFLMDSDLDQLAKQINQVFSVKENAQSSSDQESRKDSDQISDLEQRILLQHPNLTLEKLRKQMDGVY